MLHDPVRKHPPKEKGIPTHSMPTELKGRYYNPWNPDVASRGLLDVVEVRQGRQSSTEVVAIRQYAERHFID